MALETKEEIVKLVRQVQYLYGLKYEIRYELERDKDDFSESVAEHVYAMHLLSDYFLKLEDPEEVWDRAKIRQMITWHDVDEVETGDMIGWKKTDADRAREAAVIPTVISKLPIELQSEIALLLEEYESLKTVEARFVKAIDRIEPLFHLYNDLGKKLSHQIGLTIEDSDRIKEPYVKEFPSMKRVKDVLQNLMQEEGFFVQR